MSNFVSVTPSLAELAHGKNRILNQSLNHSLTHPAYLSDGNRSFCFGILNDDDNDDDNNIFTSFYVWTNSVKNQLILTNFAVLIILLRK